MWCGHPCGTCFHFSQAPKPSPATCREASHFTGARHLWGVQGPQRPAGGREVCDTCPAPHMPPMKAFTLCHTGAYALVCPLPCTDTPPKQCTCPCCGRRTDTPQGNPKSCVPVLADDAGLSCASRRPMRPPARFALTPPCTSAPCARPLHTAAGSPPAHLRTACPRRRF